MLTIRLSRTGKKGQPSYRLIVSEKTKDPWGRYLELLGNFNPRSKEFNTKKERIEYWISKGAQMSPTVNNLLLKAGIITDGKKQKSVNISKTRAAKMNKVKDEAKTESASTSAEASADKEATSDVAEKPAEAPVTKETPVAESEPVHGELAEPIEPTKTPTTEEAKAE